MSKSKGKSGMQKKLFNFAILLSILIHAALFGIHLYKSDQKHAENQLNTEDKKYKIIKIKTDNSKQLVQTTDSLKKEPVDNKFLSEKNNTFDRQTVARVIDKFRESKTTGKPAQKQTHKTQSKKSSKETKSLASLGLGLPQMVEKNKPEKAEKSNSDSEFLKEISATSAANNDYVKDIPLADVTRFNTTEYRHYGFFQRIRSQLELHWGATLKDKAKKIYKTGRQIASESDFITNIEVYLDQSGKITGINIIGTSGVKELDDAAIESFNKAGPFPNPPKDLISNGTAVIKWGFVVKS